MGLSGERKKPPFGHGGEPKSPKPHLPPPGWEIARLENKIKTILLKKELEKITKRQTYGIS